MLTTKNSGACRRAWAGLALAAVLAGCQPPGPKALLDGERLIREGEYERALRRLNKAVSLLPGNPQVWNHLGLAYHGLERSEQAARAYLQALTIDRNLAPAHFNLGCLFLEQGRLPESITELTIFTTLQPEHAEGWLKLGTAQLRARRPDDAERSFLAGLRRAPKNPELHNNLALAHLQRKRPREAVQCLNAALQHEPGYAPALLNQAVVAETYMGNKTAALERYEAYLDRRPSNAAAVRATVEQLQRELNRPPAAPATPEIAVATLTNTTTTSAPPTHVAAVPTNAAPIASPVPAPSNAVPVLAASGKTNAVSLAGTSEIKPTPAPSRPANPVVSSNNTPVASAPVEKPKVPEPGPVTPPLEVVKVDAEPAVKRASDLDDALSPSGSVLRAPNPPSAQSSTTPATATVPAERASTPTDSAKTAASEPPLLAPRKPAEEKPGLIDRMNPATWFRRNDATRPAAPPPRIYAKAVPNPAEEVERPPRPAGPRYPYRRNLAFPAGNRAEAERAFYQATEAHQQRRLAAAIELYQQAIALDPSYFEAHYNLGLAAHQSRDLPLALGASEEAVALRGSAPNARYNFAIVLRDANYFDDAARELNEVLTATPDDARAHLAAANIYAEQLDQPALATRHYRRVLELEPNHPEAVRIRAWLAGQR